MAGKWQVKSLGEIAENVSRPFDFSNYDEVTFINTGDVLEGRFLHSNQVSKNGLPGQAKKRLEKGDILFSEIRPGNKRYALVDFEPDGYVVSTKFMVIRLLSNEVDPSYFYTVLTSQSTLDEFQRIAESRSGTFPQITFDSVSYFPFSIPPVEEQKAIAYILGTLNDKIELNRQMNTTLEAMAQALFKSWFVDFDPVIDNALAAGNPIPEPLHARAEARNALGDKRKPLPAAIQQQFPNRFVFTEEIGWMPDGWKVAHIGDYLDVIETGRRPKGGVAKYDSGIPSVGAESIKGIGNFDFGKTKFIPTEFFAKMNGGLVKDYDVLLYKDGGKPGDFKPRIGLYGEGFPFDTFAINEHVFRLRSGKLGQPFLYYQVSSERNFHDLAVRGGKAAIPGVNQGDVKSLLFADPKADLIADFNKIAQPIFRKMLKNAGQSLSLQKVRDALLPKLLSGELRTPEAEKLLAEAV